MQPRSSRAAGPAVQALGQRHGGYGVRPAHHTVVSEALLLTLGQGLGDAFTDELRDAWAEACTTLATVMMDAAEPAALEGAVAADRSRVGPERS